MGQLILFSVFVFLIVMLFYDGFTFAKAKLSPSGDVTLTINGQNKLKVSAVTPLTTLGNNKVFLPSACGGGGTCAM